MSKYLAITVPEHMRDGKDAETFENHLADLFKAVHEFIEQKNFADVCQMSVQEV